MVDCDVCFQLSLCLSLFFCFFCITYVLHWALQRIILKKFMCLVVAFPTLKKTYFAELTRLFFLLFSSYIPSHTGNTTDITDDKFRPLVEHRYINTRETCIFPSINRLTLFFLLLLCCRLFRWLSVMYGISKDSRGEAVERERGRWSFVGRS